MSVVLDVQSLAGHLSQAVLQLQRQGLKVILVAESSVSSLANDINENDLLHIKAYNDPPYVDALRIAHEYEAFYVTTATMDELLSGLQKLCKSFA